MKCHFLIASNTEKIPGEMHDMEQKFGILAKITNDRGTSLDVGPGRQNNKVSLRPDPTCTSCHDLVACQVANKRYPAE